MHHTQFPVAKLNSKPFIKTFDYGTSSSFNWKKFDTAARADLLISLVNLFQNPNQARWFAWNLVITSFGIFPFTSLVFSSLWLVLYLYCNSSFIFSISSSCLVFFYLVCILVLLVYVFLKFHLPCKWVCFLVEVSSCFPRSLPFVYSNSVSFFFNSSISSGFVVKIFLHFCISVICLSSIISSVFLFTLCKRVYKISWSPATALFQFFSI